MDLIRGVYRMSMALLALAVSAMLMLAVAWVPLRLRGVRLSAWIAHGLARFLLWLYRVRFICTAVDRQALRQHEGFVFPNHLSFMDVLLLTAVWPMRFVSIRELRRWPLVGWIAIAIDTVFVNRADKTSRQQTRQQLAQEVSHYPPVVLFPEGRISNNGELQPFRFGAFEIVTQGEVAFLPCAIRYQPLAVVGWTDEPLLTVLWRVSRYPGPYVAELKVLPAVRPLVTDDPQQLARQTHAAINAALRTP